MGHPAVEVEEPTPGPGDDLQERPVTVVMDTPYDAVKITHRLMEMYYK